MAQHATTASPAQSGPNAPTAAPSNPAGGAVQLRSNARGADFATGEAMFAPAASAPVPVVQREPLRNGANPTPAEGAATPGGQGALGLTRGTQVDPALRARFRAEVATGNQQIADGANDAAIATFSRLYALTGLTPNARYKALHNLALAHIAAGRSAVALGLLREAQALPDVASINRASGDLLVQWAHESARSARGEATSVPGTATGPALRAAFDQAASAFAAGQSQAACDGFMRVFTDPRGLAHHANLRAAAITNAGLVLVRMGRAAEGVRLVQDALSVSGIDNETRLGAFDAMRSAQLAASQRTEGSGQATTRGTARELTTSANAAFIGGQYNQALGHFMEIFSGPFWAQVSPGDRGMYVFDIAVCHQHLGHKDDALTWYQNALDRHGFSGRGMVVEAIRSLRLADAGDIAARAPAGTPVPLPAAATTAPTTSNEGGAALLQSSATTEATSPTPAIATSAPVPLTDDPSDFEPAVA